MARSILSELNKLLDHGVISAKVANDITEYYGRENKDASRLQLIVFGIFGTILVGLGINLIIAHNWDTFSQVN